MLVDTTKQTASKMRKLRSYFPDRCQLKSSLKVLVVLLLVGSMSSTTNAWEWSDFISGASSNAAELEAYANTLSFHEISKLRVRDIKRRLTRKHGFGTSELDKMLDKQELIDALAFEEEKLRLIVEADAKRGLIKRSIIVAALAVVAVLCWPLIQQAFEVASVNFVVYTDRKRYEASRCLELRSYDGMVGVLLMFIVDALQTWLSVTILLSWFISNNRYFFPTRYFSLPISPGRLMGMDGARSPAANYGINIGPMIITWLMRFVQGRLETFTGKALSRALQRKRKAARQAETPEERAARKAARKEKKRLAKEQKEKQASSAKYEPTSDLPEELLSQLDPSVNTTTGVGLRKRNTSAQQTAAKVPGVVPDDSLFTDTTASAEAPNSKANDEFFPNISTYTSELDELD